nr:MAG TPA: hypothetical protein [Caudoviricetes sp.]
MRLIGSITLGGTYWGPITCARACACVCAREGGKA